MRVKGGQTVTKAERRSEKREERKKRKRVGEKVRQ